MKKLLLSIVLLLSIFLLGPLTVFADGIEDLSLEGLLRNYSLITLGQRDNGNAKVFHLTGNYLINGSISNSSSGKVIIEPKDTFATQSACSAIASKYLSYNNIHYTNGIDIPACSTLNFSFTNLYNNIISGQASIQKGLPLEGESLLELTPGSNYNIININDVKEIVFKDIDSEENVLTVITVLDSGSITMPSVYWYGENNEKYQFITNDKLGGSTAYNANANGVSSQVNLATGPYSYRYEDVYHGNIVWNLPNATSITFTGVPFVGHVIAPNADVTMPESNTAGSLIVNSFTGAGNSEIHNYPLQGNGLLRNLNSRNATVTLDCDCETGDTRPESVTVYLAANGSRLRSIVLNRENNYTYELVDLPATLDGSTDIVYTLEGDYIDEYVKGISDFNLTSGCANPTDDDDELEPTIDNPDENSEIEPAENNTEEKNEIEPADNNTEEKNEIEPTENSIAGEKENKEENPVTDDSVLYTMIISIIALVTLFVTTLSLYRYKKL